MASAFETPQRTQGRARGLLLVWKRELERKLQIKWYLPGHSRQLPWKLWQKWTDDQGTDWGLWTTQKLVITPIRTIGILSPSGLNIVKWVPFQRQYPSSCLKLGLNVGGGVPH